MRDRIRKAADLLSIDANAMVDLAYAGDVVEVDDDEIATLEDGCKQDCRAH